MYSATNNEEKTYIDPDVQNKTVMKIWGKLGAGKENFDQSEQSKRLWKFNFRHHICRTKY